MVELSTGQPCWLCLQWLAIGPCPPGMVEWSAGQPCRLCLQWSAIGRPLGVMGDHSVAHFFCRFGFLPCFLLFFGVFVIFLRRIDVILGPIPRSRVGLPMMKRLGFVSFDLEVV